MNKLTLYLIFITRIFTNTYGETSIKHTSEHFYFKDGTVISGNILWAKGYHPDARGLILTSKNKLYFHHYPYVKRLSCAPPTSYPYYPGKNPPLIHNNTVRCAPSRISFFNFTSYSLSEIRKKVAYSKIPKMDKLNAIRMIDYASQGNRPKYIEPSFEKTKAWQRNVRIYGNFYFKKGLAVWGKDLVNP